MGMYDMVGYGVRYEGLSRLGGAVATTLGLAVGCTLASCSQGDGFGDLTVSSSVALTEAQSCDGLLEGMKADARMKVEMQAREYRHWWSEDDGIGVDVIFNAAEDSSGTTAPAAEGGRASGPDSFTDTNTQVEGVDEAYFVETDGEHIYVLEDGVLIVVDSWPAADTAELARIEIEGAPLEMFVFNGRAVVFSSTQDPTRSGDDDCSRGGDAIEPGIAEDDYYGCYGGFVKTTEVDLASRTVVDAHYTEGSYHSARRHGDVIRLISSQYSSGPRLPDAWSYREKKSRGVFAKRRNRDEALRDWRRDALKAVDRAALTDWFGTEYSVAGEETSEVALACDAIFFPTAGAAAYGVTTVTTFEVSGTTLPAQSTRIVGSAGHIYANHDVLLLAQQDYGWRFRRGDDGRADHDTTLLHRFDLEGASTDYFGSVGVDGWLLDQFSMDERDGRIRAATTHSPVTEWDSWWGRGWGDTVNLVWLIGEVDGQLQVLAKTDDLAPGERVYSSRFTEDRAYVVTFRQVDPLFVIDLKDDGAISNGSLPVLGELKITGFSEYMQPVGEGHLLTVGREADENTGATEGVKLQIFDVTDPTMPAQSHSYVFNEYGSRSGDHRAFNYDASRELLTFPYVAWEGNYASTLEVFDVSLENGFSKRGAVDHTVLFDCNRGGGDWDGAWYGCYSSPYVRSGLTISKDGTDYVYSISHAGILVHNAVDLNTELARVEF